MFRRLNRGNCPCRSQGLTEHGPTTSSLSLGQLQILQMLGQWPKAVAVSVSCFTWVPFWVIQCIELCRSVLYSLVVSVHTLSGETTVYKCTVWLLNVRSGVPWVVSLGSLFSLLLSPWPVRLGAGGFLVAVAGYALAAVSFVCFCLCLNMRLLRNGPTCLFHRLTCKMGLAPIKLFLTKTVYWPGPNGQ